MARPDERDEIIDQAWEALDEGDAEEAMRVVADLEPKDPARALVEAAARLCVNDLGGSRRELERAVALGLDAADADLLWTQGELLLREWRIPDAERVFGQLLAQEKTAGVLERLSFCAELRGNAKLGAQLMRDAEKLDAESSPPIPHLSERDFDQVMAEAIGDLPEQFQRALDAVRIVVEPFPTRELARAGDPSEVAPDILGLFTGLSLLDGDADAAPGPPPTIHLFQRNLERTCADHDELREQIRITLYHELGHFLGFDEEGVDRMGLA